MDDRVRRHAEVLVEHCTGAGADDDVLIRAPAAAEDLVVALHERLGEVGARPTLVSRSPRAGAAYARAMDPDDYRPKGHERALLAETDVAILVGGGRNAAASAGVDPETAAAAGRAKRPVLEERLETRWVITRHPTTADAQRAGMGIDEWAEFFYDAVDRDWAAQRAFQARIADRLAGAEELRIVAEGTDLRMSVAGMGVYEDDATENLPGGEVATVPVIDSVEGEFLADLPVTRDGRRIEEAHLVFEDGEAVEATAARGEATLQGVLDTDPGARRVGEVGIGTNRGIDRLTGVTLFDEKAGDTVHVALGDAMDECVPDDREANDSAVHLDLPLDVSEDARIELDGEPLQCDGRFFFEDGFEA